MPEPGGGNGEIFYTLKEAMIRIEALRRHYNTVGSHSSLRYRPPAPEAIDGSAGQPSSGANAITELTSQSDHSAGPGHRIRATVSTTNIPILTTRLNPTGLA